MQIKCPYCGNSFDIDNFDKQGITCPSCKRTILSESLSGNTLMGINNSPQEMPKGLRVSLTVLEGRIIETRGLWFFVQYSIGYGMRGSAIKRLLPRYEIVYHHAQ
ncbi:MAG: TFIIB-type zinc ribbon-containing protein [Deltaproteobacteria bacterium]|nr:TFIIB-type zinc ribbon-containing protein [Deltaproteobacteria bacterium]